MPRNDCLLNVKMSKHKYFNCFKKTLIILIIDLVLNANLQAIMLHKTKIHSALFKWSPATSDGPQSVSKIEQGLVIFNLALPTTNSNLDTLQ